MIDSKWETKCGTPWFRPPELILGQPYLKELDVWSLGCIFEYLLTGKYAFSHDGIKPFVNPLKKKKAKKEGIVEDEEEKKKFET